MTAKQTLGNIYVGPDGCLARKDSLLSSFLPADKAKLYMSDSLRKAQQLEPGI
jgi:hypothetical protein